MFLDRDEIEKKVTAYFERLKPKFIKTLDGAVYEDLTDKIPEYKPAETGVFEIFSAAYRLTTPKLYEFYSKHGFFCPRGKSLSLVSGRFIDVVAFAIQDPRFYLNPEEVPNEIKELDLDFKKLTEEDLNNPGSKHSGHIVKVNKEVIHIERDLQLDKLIVLLEQENGTIYI